MEPSIACFLALTPDEKLGELLNRVKRNTHELVGPQKYLSDPPHLTLYVGVFDDLAQLRTAARQCAAGIEQPAVDVTGWKVFAADVLTGLNTLVCELSEETRARLRKIQTAAIERIAPLRDAAATRVRIGGAIERFSPARRQAVETTGFPFIGDDWEPHFTIASVEPARWEELWREVGPRPIRGMFACPWLTLYRLDEGQPVAVEVLPLGPAEV